MPGADPVTTGLEMRPLVMLFLASIVMLKIADRREAARAQTPSLRRWTTDSTRPKQIKCSSTFVAAAAAAPYRLSTSGSPCSWAAV